MINPVCVSTVINISNVCWTPCASAFCVCVNVCAFCVSVRLFAVWCGCGHECGQCMHCESFQAVKSKISAIFFIWNCLEGGDLLENLLTGAPCSIRKSNTKWNFLEKGEFELSMKFNTGEEMFSFLN